MIFGSFVAKPDLPRPGPLAGAALFNHQGVARLYRGMTSFDYLPDGFDFGWAKVDDGNLELILQLAATIRERRRSPAAEVLARRIESSSAGELDVLLRAALRELGKREGEPMPDRTKLKLGEPAVATLAPLAQLAGGETRAVNILLRRYAETCRAARPTLTLDEWEAIVDVNNGEWTFWMANDSPPLTWIDDETAARYDVDAGAVNATLAAMDYAGRIATFDVIERAWASDKGASRQAIEEALR